MWIEVRLLYDTFIVMLVTVVLALPTNPQSPVHNWSEDYHLKF